MRCYTQNIDGLESREDLCVDMDRGKGNRARFTKQSMGMPKTLARTGPGGDLDGGCEVVQLHGDLDVLRCTLCQQTCPWDEHGQASHLLSGKAPVCHSCVATDIDRQDRGKRGTKVGTLRPNIVLYGEEHPSAEVIGTLTSHDLRLSPDLLLVLGTSLHVHSLKILVKEFAKSVHGRAGGKGKVIFVNLSKPPESVWKDVFDYWISMDCDEWVAALRSHRHDLFQVQDELNLPIKKAVAGTKKVLPSYVPPTALEDDKENREKAPTSTPRKSNAGPRVIVTPKKPRALQAHRSTIFNQRPSKIGSTTDEQSLLDDQLHLHLQLPTPPSTDHRVGKATEPSKKRTLSQNYQHMFNSPSKRRRAAMTVWEDEVAI